ncbi:MAG TPA: hypothetical protein VF989_05550 [Polyangiaceae bacterium]
MNEGKVSGQRTARRALLVALSLSGFAACVRTPESNTPAIEGNRVTFSGVFPRSAAEQVFIEVQHAGGAWERLNPPAIIAADGNWATTITVPSAALREPCQSAAFRAVTDRGAQLAGIDSECLAALGPSPTLVERIRCGTTTISLESDITHTGDLAVTGPAEAAAHACLRRITGNLTLRGGESAVMPNDVGPVYPRDVRVSLPRLEGVGGNLVLIGQHAERIELPVLVEVGGDLEATLHAFPVEDPDAVIRRINVTTSFVTPRLVTVRGTLRLTNTKDALASLGSGQFPYRFGLDSITRVQNLEVTNAVFPSSIGGVAGLTVVPGNVDVEWAPEVIANALLPNVTAIGGSLTILPHQQLHQLLVGLERVGRNVTIRPAPEQLCLLFRDVLPAVTNIEGDLSIEDCSADTEQIMPSLGRVGGTLAVVRGTSPRIGPPFGTLRAGGLLVTKTGVEHLPLPWDVRLVSRPGVLGAPSATVTNNGALCQCEVDQFLGCVRSRGWTGTATTSGNLACTPCPVSVTCPIAPPPP